MEKSQILDPTSSDAAVRQAHAETNVIQEAKAYFRANGVNLDAFESRELSESVILVKNFGFGTTVVELKKLFEAFGPVRRLMLPPSGTIAIVEMELAVQARLAFSSLAYRKFKDSVIFLEKAPKGIFEPRNEKNDASEPQPSMLLAIPAPPSTAELLHASPGLTESSSTLYVRNLNFTTSSSTLRDLFKPLEGFLSARVKTKPDPKRPGESLSMGFGFLEFQSKEQAQAALHAMNGYIVEGHAIAIQKSHRNSELSEERNFVDKGPGVSSGKTKIIIKNLPFEASKKDVRSLFGAYGQLRSVRVPQKFDSSTRGFAFADFVTHREAKNAMDALRDTHLLGRRLVLEFAAAEMIDPEEEIQKMARKVERQADKVAFQNLRGNGRKRFIIQEEEPLA